MALERLTTTNRRDLQVVFKDPKTLIAFERIQQQVADYIPTAFNALAGSDFVVTTLDATVTPHGHLLTAGANINISAAPNVVTIKAVPSGSNGQIQYNNSGAFAGGDLSGDVTTAGSLATTISAHAVTYAKMQASSAASVLIGRGAGSGAGDLGEITLGAGLSMAGNVLSSSGAGGTVTSVASADGSITVTNPTTTVDLAVVKAPKWSTPRTLTFTGGATGSGSIDGSANVSIALSVAGGLGWFNVKDYGATGNGTTDDTAAINLAIAAFNTGGAGVLYCPAGAYKTTAALTAITAVGMVLGDGMDGDSQHSTTQGAASLITCTSATASLFTVNAKNLKFQNIGLKNTASTTPTAGAGITVTSSNYDQKVDYDSVSVVGFYIDVDVQVGNLWTMRNCFLDSPVVYALKIQNTASADAGDWAISDTAIYPNARNATAAIHITSAGGGKIVNCKINGGLSNRFTNGIELTGGVGTSILLVSNTSIENYSGTGIVTSGVWPHQVYSNLEFGQYGNSTGHAISISSTSDVIIDNIALRADTGTPTAIVLSSVTRCLVGHLTNAGFGTLISGTPTQDNTGGVGSSVQITGTPTAGQVPVATSGTVATWGTAAGVVSSVFARTGAVVATAGDYAASQVTNDSSVTGSTVKDALNTLSTALATAGRAYAPLVNGDLPGPTLVADPLGQCIMTPIG